MSVYKQNGIPAAHRTPGAPTTYDEGCRCPQCRNAHADELRDQSPCVTSCRLCGDTFTGTALQGREHARQHRAEHHPDIRPARRRRVSLHKFVNRDDGWKEIGVRNAAEVSAMVNRRAEVA